MRLGWLVSLVATLAAIIVVTRPAELARPALQSSSAYAVSSVLEPSISLNQNDNDDGDNDDGDNDDGDNDDGDNDDGDNEDDDNDNFDENDNFDDFDLPPLPPSSSAPERRPEPTCSTPGQDTTFTSYDNKVTVRVFASMPRPVRVEIYQVVDLASAPLPQEVLVGLLVYEIRASYCDGNPLAELPAEVNLGIRYSDIDAIGLDKGRFVIGRLDLVTGTWTAVDKRANDPATNYTSATIIQTGFYAVWEGR